MNKSKALTNFNPEQRIPDNYKWKDGSLGSQAQDEWKMAQEAFELGLEKRSQIHISNALVLWTKDRFLAELGEQSKLQLYGYGKAPRPLILQRISSDTRSTVGFEFGDVQGRYLVIDGSSNFLEVDLDSPYVAPSHELYTALAILRQIVTPGQIHLFTVVKNTPRPRSDPLILVQMGEYYYVFAKWD